MRSGSETPAGAEKKQKCKFNKTMAASQPPQNGDEQVSKLAATRHYGFLTPRVGITGSGLKRNKPFLTRRAGNTGWKPITKNLPALQSDSLAGPEGFSCFEFWIAPAG
jgi:hypothetical protein